MEKNHTPRHRLLALLLSAAVFSGTMSVYALEPPAADAPPQTATPETAVATPAPTAQAEAPDEQQTPTMLTAPAQDPAAITIEAAKDAFIQQDDGDAAYGSAIPTVLKVKNANAADFHRRAMIAFDFGEQAETVQNAQSIVLRLYVTRYDWDKYYGWPDKERGQTRLLRIYDAGSEWAEDTVTWNTAPAITAETPIIINDIELTNGAIMDNGNILELDVTDYFKGTDKTGAGLLIGVFNNGDFASGDNSGFDFASKENADHPGPQLIITPGEVVELPAITALAGLAPVEAPLGTAQANLALPTEVEATTADGTATLPITAWTCAPDYDPLTAQEYTLTGTLALTGVSNPQALLPTVQVTLVQSANTNILERAIALAQKYVDEGILQTLVPSVADALQHALDAAKAAIADKDITNATVQQQYLALQGSLWKLGSVKADTAPLADAVNAANAKDTTGCTPQSIAALTNAVNAAQALLNNPELSVADEPALTAAAARITDAMAALAPIEQPTTPPTEPTEKPTAEPTQQPTAEPTAQPTAQPTEQPTATPTAQPTAQPSAQPTAAPSTQPTAVPNNQGGNNNHNDNNSGSNTSATGTAAPSATPAPTIPQTRDALPLLPIGGLCLLGAGITVWFAVKHKRER